MRKPTPSKQLSKEGTQPASKQATGGKQASKPSNIARLLILWVLILSTLFPIVDVVDLAHVVDGVRSVDAGALLQK